MGQDTEKLCHAILGVLIPPVLAFIKKGVSTEFWISLICYILVFLYPVSVIYTFHVCGYTDLLHNILCLFIPPVTAFLKFNCNKEFWISLILCFFFWVPGVIYTYWITW